MGAGPLPAGPAGAAPPPSPKPYTGEPVVTIGRRLQALAQRLGDLLGSGGGSSSGSSAGDAAERISGSSSGSSAGDAAERISGSGDGGSTAAFSGSGRRLQQDLLGSDPYTFESMSNAWTGAQVVGTGQQGLLGCRAAAVLAAVTACRTCVAAV